LDVASWALSAFCLGQHFAQTLASPARIDPQTTGSFSFPYWLGRGSSFVPLFATSADGILPGSSAAENWLSNSDRKFLKSSSAATVFLLPAMDMQHYGPPQIGGVVVEGWPLFLFFFPPPSPPAQVVVGGGGGFWGGGAPPPPPPVFAPVNSFFFA